VHVDVSALKIHISESAHDALDAFPEFITEPRGGISVKVQTVILFYLKNYIHNAVLTLRFYTPVTDQNHYRLYQSY